MSRRSSREAVMKLLYEISYKPEEIDCILENYIDENKPEADDHEYIVSSVRGTAGSLKEIDSFIEKYSKGWKINRIAKVDLAILRLAVYEYKYMLMPEGVIINEAVELAKKYSTDKSGAFINGILASIVREK